MDFVRTVPGSLFVMRLMSALRAHQHDRTEAWRATAIYGAVAGAVTGAAAVGSLAIDPDDSWYKTLAKPAWQPPPWAFPAVWTPLYVSLAWAGGHSLVRVHDDDRTRLAGALAANLVLNAAFGWAFFKARAPAAGVAVTTCLSLSCWDLVRRTARTDRAASTALVPYAGWCTFASALNTSVWHLNRRLRTP